MPPKIKIFLGSLPFCLLALSLAVPADAAISKTSKRTVRHNVNPALVVAPGFRAAALSTSSIEWSWSTGAFTGSGIDGYYLHSSSTPNRITLALNTSYYIDAGLGANKMFTRWLTAYQGSEEGSDTDHLEKYTFALPPAAFNLSMVTSTGAYITWLFSTATAYEVQCSTNGGTDYTHNRASFVPWQTIPLTNNKNYLIRIGAINGDNEVTPGLYSGARAATTPPLTPSTFTAVALSSFTIRWQWSTGTFTGTGITGYRLYHSTTTADAELPADDYDGELVADVAGADTTSWTETFVDGSTTAIAANSRHTRWLKAVGFIESQGKPVYQKYTYAIAPATCTVVYPDPAPYQVAHVQEHSLNLIWEPRFAPGEASQYVVYYTTSGDFAVALSSVIASANPNTVSGLTDNTKYDLRVGAINGDKELTPNNGLNPFAYSFFYKVITSPHPPSNFAAAPYTDTALNFTWSTTTYTHPSYISGYSIGEMRYDDTEKRYYLAQVAFMPGVDSHEYSLNYLITNSTHTRYVWASQTDPDWTSDPHYPDPDYRYKCWWSMDISATGATFATPPNDVSFDTVTSRTVGLWWKEPIVPATKYRIERSTTTGERGPWVTVIDSTGTHYRDTGLLPLTTYSYRIGAINQLGALTSGLAAATDGNRRDYSFVSSTSTKQLAPNLTSTVRSTASIEWDWANTVPGVLFFTLTTSTDGILATGLAASDTYWIEVNLSSANTRYTRRIRSTTASGESDFAEASAATLAEDPTALSTTSAGLHSLSIGWSGNGATRYRIDRSQDRNNWTTLKSWADVHVSTSFSDSHLLLATTYYYSVLGYNQDGALSLSSATSTGLSRTLDLPSDMTEIFSTSTVAQTKTAIIPGVGSITVELPAGAAGDGYISISTSAAVNPSGVSTSDLAVAAGKLLPNKLVPGYLDELYFYDLYGATVTTNFAAPAKISFTYQDSDNDGFIDGTAPKVGLGALRILNLDTSALAWTPAGSSVVDKAARTVYTYVNHFSFYALGNLVSATGALSNMFAYPNPYKPGSGGQFDDTSFGEGIVFESLPAKAEVRIFNLAGGLVAKLEDADGDGRCLWNARNGDGVRAASGMYIYLVTSAGSTKSGKIAIIR